MSSAYTLYPLSVADSKPAQRDRMNEPRSLPVNDSHHHQQQQYQQPQQHQHQHQQQYISPVTPVANNSSNNHLSAFSLSPQIQLRSSSSSPALNSATPAGSTTLSIHYQSSEFSEADDPFFGVDFSAIDGGSPAFLVDDELRQLAENEQLSAATASQSAAYSVQQQPQFQQQQHPQQQQQQQQHAPQVPNYLPMSPDKTPSLHTPSPNSDRKGDRATFSGPRQNRGAAQALANITTTQNHSTVVGNQTGFQWTPENSESDDGLAPAATMMHAQSPRLMVSMWGRDGASVPYPLDTDQHHSTFGDLSEDEGGYDRPDPISTLFAPARDGEGRWVPNQAAGPSGVGPDNRSSAEVQPVNQLAAQRKVEERNQEVDDWVTTSATQSVGPIPFELPPQGEIIPEPATAMPRDIDVAAIPQKEISLEETENTTKPNQPYYTGRGGELTEQDVEIIRQNRNWEAAPLAFEISNARHQPPTSQAAIQKFERMCRDNDSVVSLAATWGTRRRSLPSIMDVEGITSGNFLKKLTISRGGGESNRRPSLLGGLRTLVRKPTTPANKRSRADNEDARSIGTDSSAERSSNLPKPTPPRRTTSWGMKREVPTITTAVIAMGAGASAIGASHHARNPSMSGTPTITSPKSPGGLGLTVRAPLRIRSISDLTTKRETAGLTDMLRKAGGPPVSNIGSNATANAGDADDEDDEDEDIYEDPEMRSEANRMIDDIAPNFPGFQQHILKLNPALATTNNYLVDRIAHQQIIRYKSLLNARVKHLQSTANNNCACGPLCIDMGGSANILDARGDARGMDPLSARYDGSDGDITPLEGPGVITQESFPQDIPMPPATILPAEFECQLCFQAKKFQKPSDWTKHVHEDVQPFTCTWDRCRDPKIFKRKADWVRHENEGHRHLEWWDCDVEDCRHVCYRRDNFLQHLVREHKYPEPKVKTKAAIKRAGGLDPTWQKVEQCHKETMALPQNEPCRFCGKTFPTWKKLTVHLAKHMEQISLPILKLVARKELEADTIISPVQDPPPRAFPATFPVKSEVSPTVQHHPPIQHPSMNQGLAYPPTHQQAQQMPPQTQTHQTFWYGVSPPVYTQQQQQQQGLYSGFNAGLTPTSMGQPHMNVQAVPSSHGAYSSLNMVSPAPFMASTPNFIPVTSDADFSVLAAGNALGLQDPNAVMYGNLMDPNSVGPDQRQQHFTPQGSVSPYAHSPHQGAGAFYGA